MEKLLTTECAIAPNTIWHGDCSDCMKRMTPNSVDVVLTSPPYNTSRSHTDFFNDHKKGRYSTRYVDLNDNLTPEQYEDWTVGVFDGFDRILKENGTVLYNINYGVNTHDTMWNLIAAIQNRTNFCVADCIAWKKRNAVPNTASPNKLTRIWEPVFVFCRKDEYRTFTTNKQVVSTSKGTGQKNYENVQNFVEAKNNDGPCSIHKATYSTELCEQLLNVYCPKGGLVFDPFAGTGTTALACIKLGINYICSEIYDKYVELCNQRISEFNKN